MRRKAFTLVELVLAMVITSIIGLSIAGVSMALSTSYAHTQDYYENLQGSRTALLRMQDTLRRSKLVTGASSTGILLWSESPTDYAQRQINNEEMIMWLYDSQAHELNQYKIAYPPALRPTLNVVQPLSAVMVEPSLGLIDAIGAGIYCQKTLLASDVRSCQISLDRPAPLTKCVKIALTVGDQNVQVAIETAERLRSDSTLKLYVQSGQYVLDTAGP